MTRHGSVIRVRPEKLEEYRRLHAAVWPGVLQMIRACNIRNHTIYYHDGLLFSTFEYVGDDYEADQARMAADPVSQQWWSRTDPCQFGFDDDAPEGARWQELDEIWHQD